MTLINEIDSVMRNYFPTEKQFEEWMLAPNKLLNNKSPNEMIENGEEKELRQFIFICLDR